MGNRRTSQHSGYGITESEQHFTKSSLKTMSKVTEGIRKLFLKSEKEKKGRGPETRSHKPRVYNINVLAMK